MTDLHDLLLIAHAGAGTVALLLGPVALAVRRRAGRPPGPRTSVGRRWAGANRLLDGYVAAALVVAVTAVGLCAVAGTRLLWLLPMAAGTAVLALIGRAAGRLADDGRAVARWRIVHGYGGSYLALVTALLVVAVGDRAPTVQALAWALPTAVGLPLILRAHRPPDRTRRAQRRPSGSTAVTSATPG